MEKELRIYLITIVSLFVLSLIFVLYILIKNAIFQKTFSQGKLDIKANVYVDEKTFNKQIKIVVSNRTINPIMIRSIGFIYRNERIEIIDILKQQEDVNTKFVTCLSRDSINVIYNYSGMYDFLSNYKKINKIYVYTIDTLGVDTRINFRTLKKIVKNDKKAEKKGTNLTINNNPKFDNYYNEEKEDVKEEKEMPFELFRDNPTSKEESDYNDETNIDDQNDNSIF